MGNVGTCSQIFMSQDGIESSLNMSQVQTLPGITHTVRLYLYGVCVYMHRMEYMYGICGIILYSVHGGGERTPSHRRVRGTRALYLPLHRFFAAAQGARRTLVGCGEAVVEALGPRGRVVRAAGKCGGCARARLRRSVYTTLQSTPQYEYP